MAVARSWTIDLQGLRVDGSAWRIPVIEFRGAASGPSTAIVAGMIGDKPLGVLAVHDLAAQLARVEIKGSIFLLPMINPFGFQGGTRHNPDLVELNRRFPGQPSGLISDQIAHAVLEQLATRVDCLIDLHSGTPVRTTEFAYDYGNLELSASFGYVPVMINRWLPGQICTAAKAKGMSATLIEFGGAERNTTELAVNGCLNMLRFRGHLDSAPTGPKKVAIIDQVKVFVASKEGALCSNYAAADVGAPVRSGVLGWVASLTTGERLEEFLVDEVGLETGVGAGFDFWRPEAIKKFTPTAHPILMVGQAVPAVIRPGTLAYIVGWIDRLIDTPARRSET